MKTLKKYYEEIADTPEKWFYMKSFKPSFRPDWEYEALGFIKEYFNEAGKKAAFQEKLVLEDIFVRDRAKHTVSTFLLGILLADMFDFDLEQKNSNDISFLYLWFLSCLYHDTGYRYEREGNPEKYSKIEEGGLDTLKEQFELKYLDDTEFITYKKEIVNTYLTFRLRGEHPKLDHGIIGGLLLYDRLRKQFECVWEKSENKRMTVDGKRVCEIQCSWGGLRYSENHFLEYAKAADAIIAHNIWQSTLKRYLNELNFVYEVQKINIDNQLCFLLSLADTLEPIKSNSGANVLEKVSIEKLNGESGCRIQIEKELYSNFYADKFSGEDMVSKWLGVEIIEKRPTKREYIFEIRPN